MNFIASRRKTEGFFFVPGSKPSEVAFTTRTVSGIAPSKERRRSSSAVRSFSFSESRAEKETVTALQGDMSGGEDTASRIAPRSSSPSPKKRSTALNAEKEGSSPAAARRSSAARRFFVKSSLPQKKYIPAMFPLLIRDASSRSSIMPHLISRKSCVLTQTSSDPS